MHHSGSFPAGARGFVLAHRRGLGPAAAPRPLATTIRGKTYTRFLRESGTVCSPLAPPAERLACATDPFYTDDTEALQMLLRPLFYTSFLIDDALDDDGRIEAGPILISSASSKTSLAAAFLLAQRSGVEIIGLTSSRSRAFVEGLGIYTHVVVYDEVEGLNAGPATFIDVAGDAEVRLTVHSHFGDALVASLVVGATHWEELTPGAAGLPGPAPQFFFAPDASPSAARTGARPTSTTASPRPGIRSASGSPAGWSRSRAKASTPCRPPTSPSSPSTSTPPPHTSSPSENSPRILCPHWTVMSFRRRRSP
jgi:hypothetical protein